MQRGGDVSAMAVVLSISDKLTTVGHEGSPLAFRIKDNKTTGGQASLH